MPSKNFLYNNSGAFLLETLLAVMILSFGLTAVIKSFTLGINVHQRSQEYLTASSLLQNTLTRILTYRYIIDEDASEGDFSEPFDGYRYEVLVDHVDHDKDLRKVTVSISWGSRTRGRSVSATTYLLTKPEPIG